MEETIDRIKTSARRPGVEEILVPGERSARTAQRNTVQGIPVSDETLAELETWSARLNVPLDCNEVIC
jgi:LDH2 family malate/lactate/ureidoglycolate dehydrogenase